MTFTPSPRISWAAAAIALLASPSSIAEQDAPRWFQVELLIFSQESDAALRAEDWNPLPDLRYPHAARFLIDPTRNAAEQELHPDSIGEVDKFGRLIFPPVEPELIAAPDIPLGEAALEDPAIAPAQAPMGEALVETASSEASNTEELNEADAEVDLTPVPFTQLKSAALEFRGKAAYMQRTGRYHTLFHQTWVQPVVSKEDSLAIIIDRSGDEQMWPQLQGSITLYLSRFLHLETNLWLNTTGEYLPEQWQMPAAPLGPSSIIVEQAPPSDEFMAQDPNLPLEEGLGLAPLAEQAYSPIIDEETITFTPLPPVYPYRHAILLQQKRRMRSTEVHYIDHPALGVVIKIMPLSKEQLTMLATTALEELAEREAATQLLP